MRNSIDFASLSKVVVALLIGAVFFGIMFSTLRFGDEYGDKNVQSIEAIIGKSLVQCYALEGRYPNDLYQVQKYGVIFDEDKYIYHYEWHGANLRPEIFVIER